MVKEITITARAAEKIRVLPGDAIAGHGLRVQVVGGGWSGFEYKWVTGSPEAEDLFENSGARIFLDSKSMLQLNGTELDYRSGLMQSGFVFKKSSRQGDMRVRHLF